MLSLRSSSEYGRPFCVNISNSLSQNRYLINSFPLHAKSAILNICEVFHVQKTKNYCQQGYRNIFNGSFFFPPPNISLSITLAVISSCRKYDNKNRPVFSLTKNFENGIIVCVFIMNISIFKQII